MLFLEHHSNSIFLKKSRLFITYYSHSPFPTSSDDNNHVDIIISKARAAGITPDHVMRSLTSDPSVNFICPTHNLIHTLLRRFSDDWKSAFGVFKWAGSYSGFTNLPESYDIMVDILGKSKQMETMTSLLDEMRSQAGFVTLNTVAKVMRRYSGAGKWEHAAKMFDDLGTYGLEKNTESMNLLLDTLCKEKKVDQARRIFMQLKSHIPPNANTYNIFVHGWCKVNRVDEAHWTFQEMKGCGFSPCVITYSIIVEFYCRQSNFGKVYELLDEMEGKGLHPNVITYTTIMCSMVRSGELDQALQIPERMKCGGCKPDTLFYNCMIHALGRADRLQEAVHVFDVEMPRNGVNPNTSTYNSMIAMFCHHGEEQAALNMFKQIESSTICKPDVQTFYPLLKSCFKNGNTDVLLRKLLEDMVNKHHLSLDISAYSLLIHGLCRANKCEWAFLLFEEMLSQSLAPRYLTCRLLLDECNQKFMYDAAEKVEKFMKQM